MTRFDGRPVDKMTFPYRPKKDPRGSIFVRLPKEVVDGLRVDYLDLVSVSVHVIERTEHPDIPDVQGKRLSAPKAKVPRSA